MLGPALVSQLPFGWVCFSNTKTGAGPAVFRAPGGLNCLSAGSVSLTAILDALGIVREMMSQLPFGWVCFSNEELKLAVVYLPLVSIAFRLGLFL